MLNTGLKLPKIEKECNHAFHLFVVYHRKRDNIIRMFKKNKILVNINYPYPIHKMKGYNNIAGIKYKNLSITEKLSKGIFSLPLYPKLEEKEVYRISKIIKKILKKI